MKNKCPYCKKIMIVPSWFFCNEKGCTEANAKMNHEKFNKAARVKN